MSCSGRVRAARAEPGRMLQATRTLVKSAPELWAEVADQDALAEHLGTFGTLSITDCEQERLVRERGLQRAQGRDPREEVAEAQRTERDYGQEGSPDGVTTSSRTSTPAGRPRA